MLHESAVHQHFTGKPLLKGIHPLPFWFLPHCLGYEAAITAPAALDKSHSVLFSTGFSPPLSSQTFLNSTETWITVAMATPLLSTPQPFCSASVVNDLSLVASRWTPSHMWGTQPLCDSWLTSMSTQPAWFPLKVSHSWPPHPVVAFCNDSQSGQGPPIIESTRSLTKNVDSSA